MAISNATRLSDFGSGIGTQGAVLQVDNTNKRVGIGTTNPQATLQVGTGVSVYGNSGIVSAITFYGDGSALTGVAATDNINTNNIKVSGISTLGHATGTELKITGITTFAGGDIQIDGSAVGVSSVTWDASADSLIFKDKSYAKFGDSSDLSIYHTGAESHIQETGTGGLIINGSVTTIKNAGDTETIARFTENGGVDLNFDNSTKFATTNTGAVVTGIHTASQSVHVADTITADGGTGIITATQYKGDGSALTGVGGEFDITSCLFI